MVIDTSQPTVRNAEDIAELPVEPLGTLPGIGNRVLWQDATSIAGVMTVAAGHRLGTHAHRENSHHMWILDGAAEILGEKLEPGSYVHIPSGIDHDIDATRTDGCTVYYLYLREAG